MRIIAGRFRGRRLLSPNDRSIRPTSDRLRETIFNVLSHRVQGKSVLDLFAGTGAMGIEALSRGAAGCTFIDRDRQAIERVAKNVQTLQIEASCRWFCRDIEREAGCLRGIGEPFDLAFVDPPYRSGLVEKALLRLAGERCLCKGALIVVEHDVREPLPVRVSGFDLADQRRQRKSLVSFLTAVI